MKKFKLRHTVKDVYIVTETKNQNKGWLEIHRKLEIKMYEGQLKYAKTFVIALLFNVILLLNSVDII